MELVVLGTAGVSSQSIISIRAGTTRRQAPLASVDKPFRFPCKPEECGTIKVDVFNLAGSGRVLCHGHERSYSLQLDGPQDASRAGEGVNSGDMEFSFLVRPVGSDPDGRPGEGKVANKAREAARKQAWTHTEIYLEDHHILTFMQSMLQSLIREKPDDPYGFLSRQFLARSKDTCPGELTGLPNPDCGGSESKGPPAEATLAMSPLPKMTCEASMMSSRSSSKACLVEPGPEPSLVGAAGSIVDGGSVKDVHEQVQKLQELHTEIANLREELHTEIANLREVVCELVDRIPEANRLLRANSRMRQRLASAGESLDQELSDDEAFAITAEGFAVQQPDAPACEGPHSAPEGLDGEGLRRTTCETLMAAVESGELTLALAQVGSCASPTATSDLKVQAKAMLLKAAKNGDILQLLATTRSLSMEDTEGTRQHIRSILRQGADSGEVEHVSHSQFPRAEALQAKAKAVAKPPLAPASASARLARGGASSPEEDMQRVRDEFAGLVQDKALLMAEVHKIRAMITNISNENAQLMDKIGTYPMCSHTAGFGNAGER